MLDNSNGRLIEVVCGTQSGVSVNVVVVAHSLTVQLLGLGNAGGSSRVDVQGGTLMRVLTVTQGFATLEAQTSVGGPEVSVLVLQELSGSPGSHGGVVGGSVSESASGQAAALIQEKPPFLAASTVRS